MQATIQHLGGVKFQAAARGHLIVCDQPAESLGGDTGMTPPELFLSALGTCAGFYAAEYLRTRGLSAKGLEVQVTAEKATGPARLASFNVRVIVPALAPEHEAGVLRAVRACLIHNTLTHTPVIDLTVEAGVPVEAV